MRVLVLHPPVSVARDFVDQPFQSDLGAVQLAAVLRARFEVRLVDAFAVPGATVEPAAEGRLRLGASPERIAEEVRRAGAIDAAVVATTPFHRPPGRDELLGAACAAVRAAAPRAVLLLADCYQSGQHHVDAPGEEVLASYPEADAWVKYEGEATVPALLAAAGSGARPAAWHRGAEADLDALPLPAWDLVDLAARDAFHAAVVARVGRGAWPFPIDGRTLPLVTSRGCPYRCVHCSSNPGRPPGAPKLQRRLARERVRAWCTELVERHGCTRLMVLDEMANADPAHLDALLESVEALGVRLELPNGVRADRLRRDQIERMRGRVTTLSVSAESGVQRVVDEVVGKALDLAEVERVAAEARAAGVPLIVHYMIGLPGETAEEVNGTLAHALSLHERFGAAPAVQYATPLPGTPLAARVPPAPAVDDWGPCFQARPSATSAEVPPEALARFRWAFERRVESAAAPEKLIVNLTYRCNNRCVFCAVGNRVRSDGDLDRQRAALERHRREGIRLVDFDGGEPTMSAALLPLVRHAVALGYERVCVTTNGRRCSYPAFARGLATSGITTALVSLHGADAATHGAIVGVPEAFEQTVEGLRNLVRFGPALELGVNTTISRANAGSLDRIVALAFDLGVRWVNFQFLTPFGRATRDHAPDLRATAERVGAIVDAWHPRVRIAVVNLPFCMMPGKERFLAPDLGKARRRMAFVNDEEVNLAAYLAQRRVRRPECGSCAFAICCGGFYELEDVPEPPWTGGLPPPASGAGTGANSASPNSAR